ncbi:MAG: hypothetical protein IT449_07385 [Phycisphaerales bacterium]|nr:hypothetical protein [Phycisphaerales bacterium]
MKRCGGHSSRYRRRGVALLMTLLVVVLLIAVVSRLTTATATQALIESRRRQTLQHELALDSLLLVMREWFNPEAVESVVRELDRQAFADRELDLGSVGLRVRICDDAAKLNPNVFSEVHALKRKLTLLAARLGLDPSVIDPVPLKTGRQPYRTFGQVLSGKTPVFTPPDAVTSLAWSDVLTLWGDGRIAVRRVDDMVLDVVLDDLKPGLGRELLKHRPADRRKDFLEAALAEVDSDLRDKVRQRVVFDAQRYALDIETAIGGDQRRWYLVVHGGDDLTVLHRRAQTW